MHGSKQRDCHLCCLRSPFTENLDLTCFLSGSIPVSFCYFELGFHLTQLPLQGNRALTVRVSDSVVQQSPAQAQLQE